MVDKYITNCSRLNLFSEDSSGGKLKSFFWKVNAHIVTKACILKYVYTDDKHKKDIIFLTYVDPYSNDTVN